MADHWYSYECPSGCSPPTGVILDLRIPNEYEDAPTVHCPLCGVPMHFRGRWAATEGGFGASGDTPSDSEEAVEVWLESLIKPWTAAIQQHPPDFDALHDMPPLPGHVSYGGFMEALRRRWHR